MVTVIHVVGDADVGLRPEDSRAGVDAVLRRCDKVRVRELLTGGRQEGHHLMSPLESLVAHLEVAGLVGSDTVPTRVVLVATKQNPPHARDTALIAEGLALLLEDEPAVFGWPLAVEVVLAEAMSFDAFVRAVEQAQFLTDIDPGEVVVNVAGGPVIATIGVLGGLFRLGLVPSLLEANRQDRGLDVAPHLVGITVDVAGWLARNRQYEVLERFVGDEASKAVCRALHEATRGEWPLARPGGGLVGDARTRQLLRALEPPRLTSGVLAEPVTQDDWRGWSSALERVLIAEVAAGETAAFPLLEYALRARINAGVATDTSVIDLIGPRHRNQMLAAALNGRIRGAVPDVKVQEVALGVLGSSADVRSADLIEAILAEVEGLSDGEIIRLASLIGRAVEDALDQVDHGDTFDFVTHFSFLENLDRLPQELRHLLTPNRLRWYELAVQLRHGLDPKALTEVRQVLVEEGVTGADDSAEAELVATLGLTPPGPLDAEGRVAVMCVGQRNRPFEDPMVLAVLQCMGQNDDLRLVLLASSGTDRPTVGLAHELQAWLQQSEVHPRLTVDVVACSAVESLDEVRADLTRFLKSVDLRSVTRFDVFTGPGTKAMNVAACLVGVETAFALSVPFDLHSLLPGGPLGDPSSPSASTSVVSTHAMEDSWRRLVDDEALAHVLKLALQRLDLGLMSGALQRASRSWTRVAELVDDFALLLGGIARSVVPDLRAAMDRWKVRDGDELLAARLQQLSTLLRPERRLAVARMAVTLSDVLPDEGRVAWKNRGAACGLLWRARVDALKKPWMPLPSVPDLRDLLRELELPWLKPRPLAELAGRLEREIAAVAGA